MLKLLSLSPTALAPLRTVTFRRGLAELGRGRELVAGKRPPASRLGAGKEGPAP